MGFDQAWVSFNDASSQGPKKIDKGRIWADFRHIWKKVSGKIIPFQKSKEKPKKQQEKPKKNYEKHWLPIFPW